MINKDFFLALDELEMQKKINKEQFIEALETALTSAYKKMYGEAKNALVKLNPEKNTIKIYSYKKIVEEPEDMDKEISLEEARKLKKSYQIGDSVVEEESTKEFGRIAAQTAKQVVMQKLKEIERQIAVDELSEKEDELLTTVVKRIENGVVYVQIAGSHSEGVMLETDQIPGEKFHEGDRIKVYVKRIKDSFRGPQIQVSRSNIGFVRKLFELEIPEIESGEVIIKNIARDPGNRTKVAVYSEKPNVDAVGACVGNRGVRINTIVSELNGEKIDLVLYSDDPLEYIARALSPAQIISVETNDSLKASRVIVPANKLSLAIGKSGQNVRLAARLTGWKIDVKPETEVAKEEEKPAEVEYELTNVPEDNGDFDFGGFDDLEEIDAE
ncbi:MAG: transcription termination factor NusA [Firmicutes bacterium]|jgi:N utilization substance protein A|nr:transcription termination factor NusA [Bacillota bacterium]MDY5585768.1 transcription termination factor NusA [Eubacteriales bacterium]